MQMKFAPLVVAVALSGAPILADEPPPLHGDGAHDDTAAIQARLDAGTSCVYLPPPSKEYLISKALVIGSGQELRLDRFTRIRLAPGSDTPMLVNKGVKSGARVQTRIRPASSIHLGNQSFRSHSTPISIWASSSGWTT